MTKPIMKEINIPFSGFYESYHADTLDRAIADFFTSDDDRQSGEENPIYPEDFYFKDYGYHEMEIEYCKLFVSAFSDYIAGETPIDPELQFQEMTSPREYNFTTDRIFCMIPMKKLFAMRKEILSNNENREIFSDVIRERFTSRDGFISFYRNDLETWLEKPFKDYDTNEYGTLLIAYMRMHGLNDDQYWNEYEIMEGYLCNGELDNLVYSILLKHGYAPGPAKCRREGESQYDEPVPPYRCKETLSLSL